MEIGEVETNEVNAYLPAKVRRDTRGRQIPVSSNLGEFYHFPLTTVAD